MLSCEMSVGADLRSITSCLSDYLSTWAYVQYDLATSTQWTTRIQTAKKSKANLDYIRILTHASRYQVRYCGTHYLTLHDNNRSGSQAVRVIAEITMALCIFSI